MSNSFFERLDAATNYEQLARGLYGEGKRVADELWMKCPYDDTPADKFSINAIDGRWKNHKNDEGGSFIRLIRRTHPDNWREEWARIIPPAAVILLKTPDRSGDQESSGSEKTGEKAKSEKEVVSFAERMENGRRRQNVEEYKEFEEGYGVSRQHLIDCGTWTNSGGRLGPDMRLCFGVVDPSTGEVVGIKMRCMKPVLESKTGEKLKSKNQTGSKAGVIGWHFAERNKKTVIIVEGEKDWIVASHDLPEYAVITNSNGAGSWNAEWSKCLTGRDVILLYDEDDAGNKGARRAACSLVIHAKSVKIAHLGTPDKDVFKWIREDGPGLEALKAVIASAEKFDPSANPAETDSFIKTNCSDEEAEPNAIADMLFKCMSDSGAMFNQVDDREAYCAWRGKVYEVTHSDPWWQSLVYFYTGKDAGSSEGYRLHKHIQMLAITKGQPVEATTWFARRDGTLYLPLYGPEQKMVEISAKEITIVPNGYNDVVLMPVTGIKEVDYLPDNQYDPSKAEAAWRTMISMMNCGETWRRLASAAVLALPFYDWCETHPLLRFQGATGSGKSFATKIITTLLYGQPENQGGDTMAALYRMAGTRILLALDNLEDTNLARDPEVRDLLLRAASGMTRAKSAKESERAVVAQRVNCWIMSTGKSPIGVGYEDMEERLVVIPMGGHGQSGFGGTDQIRWVQENRRLLFSYMLRQTRRIFKAIVEGQQKAIITRFPSTQRPRLQEWYSILAIANGDVDKPSDTTLGWLSSAYEGERSSVIESDPIIALLMRVNSFLKDPNTKGFDMVEKTDNGAVFSFTCHGQILHAMLARVARDCGLPYRMPSAKSLGYHLRSLSRRSTEYGFKIEQRDTQTRMADTGQRSRAWNIEIHADAVKALVPYTEKEKWGDFKTEEKKPDTSALDGTAPELLPFEDEHGNPRF